MTDQLFAVSGRIAVVTGGMGQLGAELAVALATRGARVTCLDSAVASVNPELLALVASGAVQAIDCDVTARDSVERALAAVEQEHGAPHILVNAAAVDSPPDAPAAEVGPFEDVPTEVIGRVIEVNVGGVITCCQVIGGAMARAGRGSIINVSSIYGMLSPDQRIYEFRREAGEEFVKPVAYSVSKSALYNLTRYLATYWARDGVRVNTLTLAGIANDQPVEFVDAYTSRMPMGRMMDVSEAVGAVVFLAADGSSYVTGSNLVVDGGWSAW